MNLIYRGRDVLILTYNKVTHKSESCFWNVVFLCT